MHRVLYQLKYGPIPFPMQLDHLCRNRKCVNPDHLELVTPAENVRRGIGVRLNLRQVNQIRRRIIKASGPGKRDGNVRQLASEYGISVCHVHNIVEGRKWRE